MKKELELHRQKQDLPDLRFDAEELLASEMFEIKGGYKDGCTLCQSSCAVACTSGCAVCTGCVTQSWAF